MGRAGASRPGLFLWSASKPLTPPPLFLPPQQNPWVKKGLESGPSTDIKRAPLG